MTVCKHPILCKAVVCIYLSFGLVCHPRSVNPRGNASAYTPAKPETVATPDPAVRPTAGLHVATRQPPLATVRATLSSSTDQSSPPQGPTAAGRKLETPR